MLILNSGGTFNKRYNEVTGELEVPYDNYALEKVLTNMQGAYALAGVVYKDSLEMDLDDRKMIASIIAESKEEKFILIHGTDTMKLTAEFLSEIFENRTIVITGAMKPLEVDSIEATFNLGMAIGFVKGNSPHGVYICMSGHVVEWDKIEKNREIGRFEVV